MMLCPLSLPLGNDEDKVALLLVVSVFSASIVRHRQEGLDTPPCDCF